MKRVLASFLFLAMLAAIPSQAHAQSRRVAPGFILGALAVIIGGGVWAASQRESTERQRIDASLQTANLAASLAAPDAYCGSGSSDIQATSGGVRVSVDSRCAGKSPGRSTYPPRGSDVQQRRYIPPSYEGGLGGDDEKVEEPAAPSQKDFSGVVAKLLEFRSQKLDLIQRLSDAEKIALDRAIVEMSYSAKTYTRDVLAQDAPHLRSLARKAGVSGAGEDAVSIEKAADYFEVHSGREARR